MLVIVLGAVGTSLAFSKASTFPPKSKPFLRNLSREKRIILIRLSGKTVSLLVQLILWIWMTMTKMMI